MMWKPGSKFFFAQLIIEQNSDAHDTTPFHHLDLCYVGS